MSRRVVALFLKLIPGKPPPLPHILHQENTRSISNFLFQGPKDYLNFRSDYALGNIICSKQQSINYSIQKETEKANNYETEKANKDEIEKVNKDETPEKLSLFKRFRAMYRDYWYVLVPVHIVTSIGWFGGFYYLSISGVDLATFAESLNFSEYVVEKLKEKGSSTTGYLALSYFIYKIATPLRYTVTLGGTTIAINYLKKWGYIKPIPKKEELKKMLNERKESFKERKMTVQQNLQKFRERKSADESIN